MTKKLSTIAGFTLISLSTMTWWLNNSMNSNPSADISQENVFLQTGPHNCGFAVLRYILNHMNISSYDISLNGNGPLSLEDLINILERFGIRSQGMFCPLSDLPTLPLPAILLFSKNHFIVLESISEPGHVIIMDPAKGRIHVSWEDFFMKWEGISLLIDPPQLNSGDKPGS